MKQKYFATLSILIIGVLALLYSIGPKDSDSIPNEHSGIAQTAQVPEVPQEGLGDTTKAQPSQVADMTDLGLNDLEFTDGTLEQAMDAPIINLLPDISNFEKDFETAISFAPLLNQNISVLTYNCEVRATTRLVQNGQVNSIGLNSDDPVSDIDLQHAIKELAFDANNINTGEIRHYESITPLAANGEPLKLPFELPKAARVMQLDGRYTDKPNNAPKKHYIEIDPKFPKLSFSKGTKWEQRIAVNPKLNPGGEIKAQFEVVATFVKNQNRYVRIHRNSMFKTYRSPGTIANVKMSGDSKEFTLEEAERPEGFVVNHRVDELFDLNLDTGVIEDKSTVHRTFFDGHGFKLSSKASSVDGIITEAKGREILSKIVRWQNK